MHIKHLLRFRQSPVVDEQVGEEFVCVPLVLQETPLQFLFYGSYVRPYALDAVDRLLATRLGTACAEYIENETYGIMVAAKGEGTRAVPLKKVVGQKKIVPPDHEWIKTARAVGTCLGDEYP